MADDLQPIEDAPLGEALAPRWPSPYWCKEL